MSMFRLAHASLVIGLAVGGGCRLTANGGNDEGAQSPDSEGATGRGSGSTESPDGDGDDASPGANDGDDLDVVGDDGGQDPGGIGDETGKGSGGKGSKDPISDDGGDGDSADDDDGGETIGDHDGIVDPDQDHDGVSAAADCNDDDALIAPTMVETPFNGLDDDCRSDTLDQQPWKNSVDYRSGICTTWGDTHITTCDGTLYNFQAVGDFVFLQNAEQTFVVQVRQVPYAPNDTSLAVNQVIGVKVGGDVVVAHAIGSGALAVTVNGDVIAANGLILANDAAVVRRAGNQIEILFADGTAIFITARAPRADASVLDMILSLDNSHSNQVLGLGGKFNADPSDDFQARDEDLTLSPTSPLTLYGFFAHSWRVREGESILNDQFVAAVDPVVAVGFPAQVTAIDDLPEHLRAAARDLCVAAGLEDEGLLGACTLDVALSGDAGFADLSAAMPAPAHDEPVERGGGCASWGDPHVTTFDGLAYDFQQAGIFTIAESFDHQVLVQALQQYLPGSNRVAVNTAVGAVADGDRVTFNLKNGLSINVNGVAFVGAGLLPGGATLSGSGSWRVLHWSTGDELLVGSAGSHLNFFVSVPHDRRHGISGLCGHYSGTTLDDFQLRDGTFGAWPRSQAELGAGFGASWRVSPQDSIVDLPPASADVGADAPSALTLGDFDDAAKAAAAAVCRAAGVVDPTVLRMCTFDVAATSDPDFATSAARIPAPSAGHLNDYFIGENLTCIATDVYGIDPADGQCTHFENLCAMPVDFIPCDAVDAVDPTTPIDADPALPGDDSDPAVSPGAAEFTDSAPPGGDALSAGSSPGGDALSAGSSPGGDALSAGSSPGGDALSAGSSPGGDEIPFNGIDDDNDIGTADQQPWKNAAEYRNGTCVSWGDTHITTCDGTYYDFQGIGDFVFLQDESQSFVVQVRQVPYPVGSPSVAVNRVIGVSVGDDVVVAHALTGGGLGVTLNGEITTATDVLAVNDTGMVRRDGDTIEIVFTSGTAIFISARAPRPDAAILDMVISVDPSFAGHLLGLGGKYNSDPRDDFQARDEDLLLNPTAPLTLYGFFAKSWRVRAGESILDDRFVPENDAVFAAAFPTQVRTKDDVPEQARLAAREVCAAAGIEDEGLLAACTLDVALTGDAGFAFSSAAVPAPARQEPFGHGGGCASAGDPHLITFDGLAYDFQQTGVFTLAETFDRQMIVQALQLPWFGSTRVAVNAAVGALADGDRVVFSLTHGLSVEVNGVAFTGTGALPGGATLSGSGSWRSLRWSTGDELLVSSGGTHLNFFLSVPQERREHIAGLCGYYSGRARDEFRLRDGTFAAWPRSQATLYAEFGSSWRVSPEDSMIQMEEAEISADFPSSIATLDDFSADEQASAQAACRAAGVVHPAVLTMCIFDVVATLDVAFAVGDAWIPAPSSGQLADYFIGQNSSCDGTAIFGVNSTGKCVAFSDLCAMPVDVVPCDPLEQPLEPPSEITTTPESPGVSVDIGATGYTSPGYSVYFYNDEACQHDAIATAVGDDDGVFSLSLTVLNNQETRLYADVSDQLGSWSSCVMAIDYIHDDQGPAQPSDVGLSATSGSAQIVTVSGQAEAEVWVELFASVGCSGDDVLAARANAAGAFALPATPLYCATTAFSLRLRDAAGNLSACLDVGTYAHHPLAEDNSGCGPYRTCGEDVGGPACVDVDECETDNGGCDPSAACTNNDGAAPTCGDTDECQTNNGGCGAFRSCTNNEGAPPTCTDVDECQTNNGGCGPRQGCTNNDGAAPTCADLVYPVALSTGAGPHICALMSDASARCWGNNVGGQVGMGSTAVADWDISIPRTVIVGPGTPLTNVNTVSTGDGRSQNTCALDASGALFCWGSGDKGQLGTGSNSTQSQATPVVRPAGWEASRVWQQVEAGDRHVTCAVSAGEAYCFGEDAWGALGNDAVHTNRNIPVKVGGSEWNEDVLQVSTGGFHACALVDEHNGTTGVYCWGDTRHASGPNDTWLPQRVFPDVTDATQVNASYSHTCVLTSRGEVWCAGDNALGATGGAAWGSPPAPVAGFGSSPGEKPAKRVITGSNISCALVDENATTSAYCWGVNNHYSLGIDLPYIVAIPTRIQGTGNVQDVVINGRSLCTLNDQHRVLCRGDNLRGFLGTGTVMTSKNPVTVRDLSGAQALALGHRHSCALDAQGAWCWGDNASGQLGDGSLMNWDVPVAVEHSAGATQIVAGRFHTCLLAADATVSCTGDNSVGALGLEPLGGTRNSADVAVAGLSNVVALDSSAEHTCAIAQEGGTNKLYCWGLNNKGQLGDGGLSNRASIGAAVTLPQEPRAVATGDEHTCVLLPDSTVQCWGANTYGQLGNLSNVDALTPVQVKNASTTLTLTGIVQIAAGSSHVCALNDSGSVYCWGWYRGPNGSATYARNAATAYNPGGVATSISAGGMATCALLADQSAKYWSGFWPPSSEFGGINNNLYTYEDNAPGTFAGISDGGGIACGPVHACVVRDDETVACLGQGLFGQLGDDNAWAVDFVQALNLD